MGMEHHHPILTMIEGRGGRIKRYIGFNLFTENITYHCGAILSRLITYLDCTIILDNRHIHYMMQLIMNTKFMFTIN